MNPNSKIEIQLKGLSRFGHEVVATPFSGTYHFGGGGNGSSLDYSCAWIGNKRSEFSRDFNLTIKAQPELVLNKIII